MIQVYCKNTGTTERFQEGTSLLQMLGEFSFDQIGRASCRERV